MLSSPMTLHGREVVSSSADMVPSSSASQSEKMVEQWGEASGEGVDRDNLGGVVFRTIMACLKGGTPKLFQLRFLGLLGRLQFERQIS